MRANRLTQSRSRLNANQLAKWGDVPTKMGFFYLALFGFRLNATAMTFMNNLQANFRTDHIILWENGISLVTVIGLVVCGLLVVRRSGRAWVAIVTVLILSVCDSVVVIWFFPPLSSSVTPAVHTSIVLVRIAGLIVPVAFYLGSLCYLIFSRSYRLE